MTTPDRITRSLRRPARLLRVGEGRDQRGTSVLELSVTVMILSIVLGTAFGAFASLQNASQGSNERTQNLSHARLIMASLTKDLRTATRLSAGTSPFELAKSSEAVFYANLDTAGAPKKVRLHVQDSRLIEEVTTSTTTLPPYSFNPANTTVRMVGEFITPTGAPMFSYFSSSGAALALQPDGTLSAADRLTVQAVGISLSVRRGTNLRVASTTLVNRVRLPNHALDPTSAL